MKVGRGSAFCCMLLAFGLVACTAPAPIPEPVWYRLPPASALPALPRLAEAIAVEGLRAEGVHGDQPLLHAATADALALRQYHYHLWAEPPTRLIEQRLRMQLREAGAAPLVLERLPDRRQGLRIQGRLLALERVPDGRDGWLARVAIEYRIETADGRRPPWVALYEEREPATGSGLQDSVLAMGRALDRLHARLAADLGALGAEG